MLFGLNAAQRALTITMNQVQYDLLAASLAADQAGFERLLLSHLQMWQVQQESRERETLKVFVESAPKDQRMAVLDAITTFKADLPIETIEKG